MIRHTRRIVQELQFLALLASKDMAQLALKNNHDGHANATKKYKRENPFVLPSFNGTKDDTQNSNDADQWFRQNVVPDCLPVSFQLFKHGSISGKRLF